MRALIDSDIQFNKIVCSDINGDLIRLWQDIKDYPLQLADRYQELWTELNGQDDDKARKISCYNAIRTRFNDERSPADFIFLLRTCANGMPRYNSHGQFNTSFHITRDGIQPDTLRHILVEWGSLLNRYDVEFRNCSYHEIITGVNDFLYLDPPYAVTKGFYYGSIELDDFFCWLKSQPGAYALSFDGKVKDGKDCTYSVPEELYSRHVYLRSGN